MIAKFGGAVVGVLFLISCTRQPKGMMQSADSMPDWNFSDQPLKSDLSIPISLSMATLERQINDQIPRTFQNSEWPDYMKRGCADPEIQYQVTRDDIHLKAEGTTLYFEMDLYYSIAGQVCATCWDENCLTPKVPFSCGCPPETKRKMHWIGKIMWGIDADYQVKTISETVQLAPFDPCAVTFLKINVTDIVVKEMRAAIDQSLAETDRAFALWNVREPIQKWCNTLYNGVPLDDFGALSVQFNKLYISQIRSEQDSLFALLGVESVLQWMPASTLSYSAPLPKLLFQTPPENGFHVAMNANWNWVQINDQFNQNILFREWSLDEEGGYIVINASHLWGDDTGKIYAEWEVDFKKGRVKRKKVKIKASMDVHWNQTEQSLTLENIEWDLNTRHLLLKWGIQAETWNQAWQKNKWMKISVGAYYPQTIAQINALLMNRIPQDWKINGGINQLNVANAKISAKGLQVEVIASGQLQIKVLDWKN